MIHDDLWTDALLFSPEEPHVRLVLAATFGHPKRSPSITELEEATGLRRQGVIDAQRQIDPTLTAALEAAREYAREYERGWRPTGDELVQWVIGRRPDVSTALGLYKTPARTASSYPKHDGTNQLAAVVEHGLDPDHDEHPFKVPVQLKKKLPGGSRSNAVTRLVLAYYVRQQLIHGAILPDDLRAAEQLHLYRIDQATGYEEEPAVHQVEGARGRLLAAGALERHPTEPDLFVIPGGSPPVREFYRASFKTARRIPLGGRQVARLDLPATDKQDATIRRLLRLLGPDAAQDALWPGVIDEAEYDDDEGADLAIACLETALSARREPQTSTTGTPNDPGGNPKRAQREPAISTFTLDPEPLTASGREEEEYQEPGVPKDAAPATSAADFCDEGGVSLSGLPLVAATLGRIFPAGPPTNVRDDLAWMLRSLPERNDGVPLTPEQLAAVDRHVESYLYTAEVSAADDGPQATFARVRRALRAAPNSEDLLGELRRIHQQLEPDTPGADDYLDDLLDRLYEDVPE